MRLGLKYSTLASAALVASACAGPQPSGLFEPGAAGSDAAAGRQAEDAGASSCESGGAAGAGGADARCRSTSGGVAGGASTLGATTGGAGGAVTGGGASNAGLVGGAANAGLAGSAANAGVAGGGGVTVAGSSNGGTSGKGGGGGNATGGTLSKCELLLVQANAQLQGAQTCSTASGEAFCTGYTNNECGCKVPVNKAESVSTENYVKAREAFKSACPVTCSTPCVEPKSQTCQLIFGLVVGSCVAM